MFSADFCYVVCKSFDFGMILVYIYEVWFVKNGPVHVSASDKWIKKLATWYDVGIICVLSVFEFGWFLFFFTQLYSSLCGSNLFTQKNKITS